MGQKVHPVGFRVGITKPYQSQWFARFHKYQYSQTIFEDRLLRQTLMNLFPTLLNPFLKKIKKRDENTTLSPKITHIKIERGLIPYQIGIQIHAENCELIKSAIDNLTVNKELLSNLQKARRYLFLLKMKPNFIIPEGTSELSTKILTDEIKEKRKDEYNTKIFSRNKNTVQKRLRKRQEMKKFLMVLQKKASRFSVTLKKNTAISMRAGTESFTEFRFNQTKFGNIKKKTIKPVGNQSIGNSSCSSFIRNIAIASSNKTKGAAFDVFLNKTQKKFLKHLKEHMKYWNQQMKKKENLQEFELARIPAASLQSSKKLLELCYPLGYNKNWNFQIIPRIGSSIKSISKLTKLVQIIEKKSLIKMDRLRYDFVSSGRLSKAQTFGYYQIIHFLKNLKEYIKKQRNIRAKEVSSLDSMKIYPQFTKIGWVEKNIQQRLNNIDEECRKIKFIEYLKKIVQKHRQENIYFYLSTIADSKKNLKKIQQFTKIHSNLLFGFSKNERIFDSSKIRSDQTKMSQTIGHQIKEILQKPTELQNIFFKQIEKQRKISQENCELTQKISLKFYSTTASVLETKASIVAENIVDALEKRQAFRKVIKQAMAKAMKNTRVKGIKIQVAGRLNGAEIARTEWARSGRVPLQTLTANIDYSYKTANTIYGIIGIKVWIFKGYTKIINSN